MEDLYKIIVEEASVLAALYTGPEIRIRVVNRLMLKAWGKDESIINKTIREANPEWENQPFFNYLDNVYRTGIEYTAVEERADMPVDGHLQTFYFNFNYKPLKHADGTVWGIVHTALDVTEQVLTKRKRELAEEMLRLAADSAALGTWFLDGSDRALQASARTKELFGYYSDENMSYDAVVSQITEEHRERTVKAVDAVFTKGTGFDIEFSAAGFHDKKLRWLRATGRLYEHEETRQPFLAGIIIDITAQKMSEQRKDEFISVASHELKTPLTSLNAGLQLLDRYLKKETGMPEKLLKITSSIKISLRKISLLVDDLLNVTKIEKGQLKLNKEWFTISEVINNCCDHVRLQGNHELNLSGDLTARMYADEQKIDQVIVNLVNNAVKYAPGSSVINLTVEAFPDKAKVSVQDYGIGIAKDKVKQIFNRFYQVKDTSLQFSGLGLGLYISAEIIKQHGGEMGVDSEIGKGSTFWFTIPVP